MFGLSLLNFWFGYHKLVWALYFLVCCKNRKNHLIHSKSLFLILYLQLGHNIEKVREKMRELTKQIVLIYSASKCFPYILEGLRSKNNRTRIECADLIGFIIDHHGAEVMLLILFGDFFFSVFF